MLSDRDRPFAAVQYSLPLSLPGSMPRRRALDVTVCTQLRQRHRDTERDTELARILHHADISQGLSRAGLGQLGPNVLSQPWEEGQAPSQTKQASGANVVSAN